MSYLSFSNILDFKSTKKKHLATPWSVIALHSSTLHSTLCCTAHTAHYALQCAAQRTLHTHISYAVNHSHPTMLACIAFKGHLNLRNHVKILRGFSLPLCHRSRSRALPPIAIEPQINCPRKQNKSTLNYQNSFRNLLGL